MKTKRIAAFAASMLALLVCSFASAAEYIDAKPLSAVVKTPVQPVKSGEVIDLPLITWGGDIATILANGNQKTTSAGIFAEKGLQFNLVREDIFSVQVENYMSGKTPFLRGTVGMVLQAMDVLSSDPRTTPVVIYQMTWSTGGDALVVREGINKIADLKGKTIVVQAYGPHVDLLTRVLADGGLKPSDVNIKWVQDLTGTENTPYEAMLTDETVDAAFCIIPDALLLTSNGTVGTGTDEASVKGATIRFSTKSANTVISDVYVVRRDYLDSNQAHVQKFVHGLMTAQEKLSALSKDQGSPEWAATMAASGQILLGSVDLAEDAKALYGDCTFVGYAGNKQFLADQKYPRRLSVVQKEIDSGLRALGLKKSSAELTAAAFDFDALSRGLTKTESVEMASFDADAVAQIINSKAAAGGLDEASVIEVEIRFEPNQSTFDISSYREDFDRVIQMASVYGGAALTVEGHSDVLGYLQKRAKRAPTAELKTMRQSAKNLSLSRANTVRDAIINYAEASGITLDEDQFVSVGHGIDNPSTGVENGEPVAPKNEEEWKANMRVVFQVVPVESEATAFAPIQ